MGSHKADDARFRQSFPKKLCFVHEKLRSRQKNAVVDTEHPTHSLGPYSVGSHLASPYACVTATKKNLEEHARARSRQTAT